MPPASSTAIALYRLRQASLEVMSLMYSHSRLAAISLSEVAATSGPVVHDELTLMIDPKLQVGQQFQQDARAPEQFDRDARVAKGGVAKPKLAGRWPPGVFP